MITSIYHIQGQDEDQMFKMLLDGKTWAEAAWSSMRQLSNVNTVVGDLLMTWKQISPGDINMDGLVDQADFSILAQNWGTTGQSGGSLWNIGDLNCDGAVDSTDLAILQDNGVDTSSWTPIFIPEPSAGILLMMSIAAGVAGMAIQSVRKK